MKSTTVAVGRWIGALGVALLVGVFSSAAAAQEEKLQNDGWTDNTAAGFQAGFVSGEIGAAVFVPDAEDYPVTLKKVQLLFGGAAEGQTREVGIRVWQDNGGPSPGALVHDETYELTSSTNAFTEVDLSAANLQFSGRFRVGVVFMHNGLPAIARDDDPGTGNDFPDRNYIFAQGVGWVQSSLLGVLGDWIIRAVVDVGGGSTGCAGDAACGAGSICEDGACQAGCRADASCGAGRVCNDLVCEAGCRTDDACDAGQVCDDGTCQAGCRTSADCMGGEVCDEGQCSSPPGCVSDADCPEQAICLLRTGECMEVACRDDSDCDAAQVCSAAFTCEDVASNNNPNNPGNNNTPEPAGLSVTSITPSSAPNDRDAQITVVGAGFTAETVFRIGPTRLTQVTVQNETVALATVPAGITPGVYDVVVSQGADQYVFTQGFSVEDASPAASSGGGSGGGCQTSPGRGGSLLALLLAAAVGWMVRR